MIGNWNSEDKYCQEPVGICVISELILKNNSPYTMIT